MNAPAPGKGQYVHTFSDPDKLVDSPMICHLDYEPPNKVMGWFERLYLDKVFHRGGNVYNLLDRCVISDIEEEALAALKASRVEID